MYKEYSWKTKWTVKGLDANKVGQELEKINEITAENVLKYAKAHTKSEIYKAFEWDDAIASENWRKHQASILITNISVIIIEDEERKNAVPIRAFVQPTTQRVYEPIEVVIQDVNKYQQLLEKAYKELNTTKNKYQELEEIQELLKDIPQY